MLGVVVITLTLASCGGGDAGDTADGPPAGLDSDVASAALAVSTFCLSALEGTDSPNAYGRKYGRMLEAVDTLVEAYREYPGEYEDEVKDAASSLDRCGEPEQVRRLDRELE